MIMWQLSKYNVNEGDGILEICAATNESLSSPITVTNVMVEDVTATGKDCLLIGQQGLDSGFRARGCERGVCAPLPPFQNEAILANKNWIITVNNTTNIVQM